MQGLKILGTGSYAPKQVITNDYLAQFMETSDEWITSRTGIKQRHISDGEPTWYMGVMAGKKAIEMSGIDVEEIDLILLSSTTEDFFLPSGACIIQRELGIKECMTVDVNCACSGFVYAIDIARRYLLAGDIRKILVVASESLSKIVDYDDRTTCILFGDGAGACIVEADDVNYSSFHGADGNGAKYLVARHFHPEAKIIKETIHFDDGIPDSGKCYLMQDGKEVYKFATSILPYSVNKAAEKYGISVDEIDWFIPHQANIRIIETAAKKLNVPTEKFIINIAEYGNTSSASIPIALDEAVRNGTVKRGDTICFVGFGAGLTYGAVIMKY